MTRGGRPHRRARPMTLGVAADMATIGGRVSASGGRSGMVRRGCRRSFALLAYAALCAALQPAILGALERRGIAVTEKALTPAEAPQSGAGTAKPE